MAKLGNVLEESDESAFWLDMLVESGEEVPVERVGRASKPKPKK